MWLSWSNGGSFGGGGPVRLLLGVPSPRRLANSGTGVTIQFGRTFEFLTFVKYAFTIWFASSVWFLQLAEYVRAWFAIGVGTQSSKSPHHVGIAGIIPPPVWSPTAFFANWARIFIIGAPLRIVSLAQLAPTKSPDCAPLVHEISMNDFPVGSDGSAL